MMLLVIVLLMTGITVLSLKGSRAAEEIHKTIKQAVNTNIFEIGSSGVDGDGQRTIG